MKTYDVCIIGSGASGGMTAQVLTEAGLDCVMLEAGPMRPVSQFPIHRIRRWNLPGRGLHGHYFQEWLSETGFLADEKKEPYTVAGQDHFAFWRVRAVGGKSLFWVGVAPRFGPEEFQPLDDYNAKWPVRYEEIAPYMTVSKRELASLRPSRQLGPSPGTKALRPSRPRPAKASGAVSR
ncbi:FAD-dependent monooxygenase [Bryobacter aggregatus]|uniref:FAD-dependent monooxygenase n=1 Tax=Bryobacter aggregatus TaxID=360054 RepID=UPI0004E19050|nr:FAD-dependent monooxygenase [Bryobacter aggregatus]